MTTVYEFVDAEVLLQLLDARAKRGDGDARAAAVLIRQLQEEVDGDADEADARDVEIRDVRSDLNAAREDRDELVRWLRVRAADAYADGAADHVELLDRVAAEIQEVLSWL